mmetsp:Transcript_19754/g.54936  ORF Transcript_19754/g.54936 Transcript_19754/m.54936 type:complete len:329 (+) Transcript_19754:240-1226(+)
MEPSGVEAGARRGSLSFTSVISTSPVSSSIGSPVCSASAEVRALTNSMSSGRLWMASQRLWRAAKQLKQRSLPPLYLQLYKFHPKMAAKRTVTQEPKVSKAFESWVNSQERPRRASGRIKNMTMMYTNGNPRQKRVAFPSWRAAARGIWRMNGTGYQMRIPEMLKNKWARATRRALVPSVTKAERMAVPVVPMLAPRVSGSICSRRRTPIPTSGVSAEVVMEEDWTTMVIPAPSTMARYPLMLVALWMMRVEVPRSIFWSMVTMAKRQTKRIPMEMMKMMNPAIWSSFLDASAWKKAGQSPVFLSQEMRPTLEQDFVVGLLLSAQTIG